MKVTNPYKAVRMNDTHAILNSKNQIVQFDGVGVVDKNCNILNEHEIRNGREPLYVSVSVDDIEIEESENGN